MMKSILLFVLLASSLVTAAPMSPRQEIAKKVPEALKILNTWRLKDTSKTEFKRNLRIVYWTPSDRAPALGYQLRLTRVMTHIQAFYAKEMKRFGFGPQTIQLNVGKDKLLKIHVVKAPNPYAHYKPSDGQKIRKECESALMKTGIDIKNETIIIFCNMSNWDKEKRKITQNSPYYAVGSHRGGCAWQVDSPLLDPVHLDKKDPKLHDGQYGHISIGKYNSIFIGGVAHELGHTLGLPHNCQRHDEKAEYGLALMGAGNRSYGEELRGVSKGSFLTLAHGLRLTTHPMFSGTNQAMELPKQSKLTEIQMKAGAPFATAITVTGKVDHTPGSPPIYAILAYCDPEGGGNYDATTASAIPDAEGNFTLYCTDLKPNKSASLRLIALYANGDATSHIGTRSPYTYPYQVAKDGTPSLNTRKKLNNR